MVMTAEGGWRGVMVPPPNMLAGIGAALRRAFPINDAGRTLDLFHDLTARLAGCERRRPPAR